MALKSAAVTYVSEEGEGPDVTGLLIINDDTEEGMFIWDDLSVSLFSWDGWILESNCPYLRDDVSMIDILESYLSKSRLKPVQETDYEDDTSKN